MSSEGRSVAGVGDVLDPHIVLETAEGEATRLGAFYGQVLVVHCLRYYG